MDLEEVLEKIEKPDEEAKRQTRERWNKIAHPLHSLGKLEDVVVQIAGITRDYQVNKAKKALVIFCADHGVVEEGVTQTGQEVTAVVAENFLDENATAAIFCREMGADIFPIDIGMATDTKVPRRKIAYGTKNMAKEPAMTREQALLAVETGITLVRELKEQGYGLIATGEMGIGNTTCSSAVVSVLLDKSAAEVTGKGAGLTDAALQHKIEVVEQAISLHQPRKTDVIDVLSKVGGFELAGMAGLFLGGALYKVPIVIDGFISATAALAAYRLKENCRFYMIPSHVSKEPAAQMVLDALSMKAPIHADMCLGEGSGAVACFPLIDLAIAVYRGMGTFEEHNITPYEELNK